MIIDNSNLRPNKLNEIIARGLSSLYSHCLLCYKLPTWLEHYQAQIQENVKVSLIKQSTDSLAIIKFKASSE